jgi:hypothetical protein
MFDPTRRSFLQRGAIGLAAVGASGLLLRSDAQPTQEVSRDSADRVLIQMGPAPKEAAAPKAELRKVTPQPYGPLYRVENAIAAEQIKVNGASFETGVFDVVLEPV